MERCPQCGGTCVSMGDGKFRCEYCEKVFTAEADHSSGVDSGVGSGVGVFERNKDGVLEITCSFDDCMSSGSGFLINPNGYAITNAHVVTNGSRVCKDITVKIAGKSVRADIVKLGDKQGGMGPGVDLALIELETVPSKARSMILEDYSKVRMGEQVFVIGNSLGDGTCITSGIVSDNHRMVNGKRYLMTDCAINGGNSGGPIFNNSGIVIGAIVASRVHEDGKPTEGMNYAIPSDTVADFITSSSTGEAKCSFKMHRK